MGTKGKQESIESIGEIADQEVATSAPDGKQKEKATDSFVNIVAEEEGRQEPTEQEVTKEDSKEEKAADFFVNNVAEAEGRQEQTEEEKTKEDKGIYKLKKDLETEKGQEERNQDTEGKQQ